MSKTWVDCPLEAVDQISAVGCVSFFIICLLKGSVVMVVLMEQKCEIFVELLGPNGRVAKI
jgi:hypothetical protein